MAGGLAEAYVEFSGGGSMGSMVTLQPRRSRPRRWLSAWRRMLARYS